MMEVKGVGRRTQLLDNLRNRRRYWELKIKKGGNDILSIKHREELQVILFKSTDLLISSILNNNNSNKPNITLNYKDRFVAQYIA